MNLAISVPTERSRVVVVRSGPAQNIPVARIARALRVISAQTASLPAIHVPRDIAQVQGKATALLAWVSNLASWPTSQSRHT